jgi:putative two-component system response regulator
VKSILIVDDNLASLKQISAQLAELYEVSLAKSGEIALQICADEKPDLILLDMEMPGMDGFEVLSRLQSDPALKHIPVIFLTGNYDSASEIRCLEAGAVDFFTKPANTDILRRRISLHLEFATYQLQQEEMEKELKDNIGMAFAELVECKDYNIAGHVHRTGIYASFLAEELYNAGTFGQELAAEDIELIRRAAPFHDIGKLGISDILLLKQGALIPQEYEEIRKHALIGSQVMEVISRRLPGEKYLKLAICLAKGHHERWDGRGYPCGLKGEDIPLLCRILAVANVYDACMTDRVYRKGKSHEESCKEIIAGSGTEFDSRIVDVFMKLREKFALLHTASHFSSYDLGWSFCHETNLDS